ncbi:MAG: DMT family transporter [Hyphomicrobiaceae bacterium]
MSGESGNWGATAQGIVAIALWSTLASLGALSGPVPPFQLTAISFTLATLVGLGYFIATGQSFRLLAAVPAGSWALGVYGLLGYHVAYFLAIKAAPPVEVSIISYLWPLLIVLFSGLLPASAGGGPLRWWHVAGAALGFAGAALVPFARGGQLDLSGSAIGYGAALAAAFIWSSYSVASRLFARVPSAAVMGSCALTALGAAAGHLLLETTQWPRDPVEWAVSGLLGLGPVGIAFYLWDAGMKQGKLRLLGVLSYATPLLSTALLVGLGLGQGGPLIWLAVALVVVGALLAAADTIFPRRA